MLQHPSSAGMVAAATPLPAAPPSGIPTTDDLPPIEEFDAPNDLAADERAIWLKQAPHAFRARTLTRSTALAFERYCKIVAMERREAVSSGVGGPNHRGLIKQVHDYELEFCLAPKGAPVLERPLVPAQPQQPAGPAMGGKLAKFRG